jgi:hypothetical protein
MYIDITLIMDVVNKLDMCLKECLEKSEKTEDEIFDIFNRLLNKHRNKQTNNPTKPKKKRKIVCRPAMIISDSSDNE